MPSKRSIAIAGVAVTAAAAVTIAAVWRNKRTQEEEEDAFSPTTRNKTVPTPVVARSKTVPAPVTTGDQTVPAPDEKFDADLLDGALSELEMKEQTKGTDLKESTLVDPTDRQEISHLGLSMKVPSGWDVREELSPVPNVAMITVWNPEFANMPDAQVPGAVPVMILSVEDIRGENLNLNEFKERSKELSLQQMLMLTGGAIPPIVCKDTTVSEGPFRHALEYAQSMVPYFEIYVINLLEVRNGVAYVFQIMCRPNVMNQYRSIFMSIARDTVITPMEGSSPGYLEVNTGKVSLNIDTTWSWSVPCGEGNAALATFELLSSVKKEEVTLYNADEVPTTTLKARNEKTVDGVFISSIFDGSVETKTVSFGGYSFVVRPLQKAISYLPESSLVEAIKSVRQSDTEPLPKNGAIFYAPEYGYRFNVVAKSRVIATKLGNGTVVYAPEGLPQDITKEIPSAQQAPTVTIRIGSPERDPDCMSTLTEWHTRIEAEAAEGSISNIRIVSLKGEQCLTFVTKEMQEVGPGERLEVKGNAYIFVRDGMTTIIRWETSSGQWSKYEGDWKNFLDSFEFL